MVVIRKNINKKRKEKKKANEKKPNEKSSTVLKVNLSLIYVNYYKTTKNANIYRFIRLDLFLFMYLNDTLFIILQVHITVIHFFIHDI